MIQRQSSVGVVRAGRVKNLKKLFCQFQHANLAFERVFAGSCQSDSGLLTIAQFSAIILSRPIWHVQYCNAVYF